MNTTYSAYGIQFGLPGGDSNSDGKTNASDLTQVQTWINTSHYDVRGDIDLDGDVDAADKSTINLNFTGITLGRGSLSAGGVANRRGYAGYQLDTSGQPRYRARNRLLLADLGRWHQRDGTGMIDGPNLYGYVAGHAIISRDPTGNRSYLAAVTLPCPTENEVRDETPFTAGSVCGRGATEEEAKNAATARCGQKLEDASGDLPDGPTYECSGPSSKCPNGCDLHGSCSIEQNPDPDPTVRHVTGNTRPHPGGAPELWIYCISCTGKRVCKHGCACNDAWDSPL